MGLKIRLSRAGAKKRPYYHIVVADSRSPRDGRFIATIGSYRPKEENNLLTLDVEKAREWVSKGAVPSDTVAALFKKAGV